MVAGVEAVTVEVVMEKVADDEPGSMVTVFGTTAVELELLRVTVVLWTTGPERTTLPLELVPPVTVIGLTDRLVKVTGEIVSVAVLETDARLARMVAIDFFATFSASTLKDAEEAPGATATELGSDTIELGPVIPT